MTKAVNIKKTRGKNAVLTIEGELPAQAIEDLRAKAVAEIGKDLELPGFRKGKIPPEIVVQAVGEFAVLETEADLALREEVPALLEEDAKEIISRPEIKITKLAKGNPLCFTITAYLYPKTTLPDYKKIAEKIWSVAEETPTVTEEELLNVLNELLKTRAKESERSPELTDELAKTFGDFATAADFKEKVRNNMVLEKSYRAKEKRRIECSEKFVSESEVELPQILTEGELGKMLAGLKDDVSRMGLKFEDYLKNTGKTESELLEKWRPEAEKRAKLQIILQKIAAVEKIQPAQSAVERETSHLLSHYHGADKERAAAYVLNILTNEKVYEFLENQQATTNHRPQTL